MPRNNGIVRVASPINNLYGNRIGKKGGKKVTRLPKIVEPTTKPVESSLEKGRAPCPVIRPQTTTGFGTDSAR
jgi:hypothetical protein